MRVAFEPFLQQLLEGQGWDLAGLIPFSAACPLFATPELPPSSLFAPPSLLCCLLGNRS